jgi:hypothetical protein
VEDSGTTETQQPDQHAAFDPFDIASIVLSPAAEGFKTKAALQRIAHGRPRRFEQIRVNRGLPLREGLSEVRRSIQLGIIKREDDAIAKRHEFACSAAVTAEYEATGLVVRHSCFLAQYRSSGALILWTIKTASSGILHPSSESQLQIAEAAVHRWVGMEWNGLTYELREPEKAAAATYREPIWTIISWDQAIRLAFPGDELIRDVNNPLILDMLGLAKP